MGCLLETNRIFCFGLDYLNRLYDLGRKVNILAETMDGIWINTNKSKGSLKSWRRAVFIEWPVSPLYQCDLCNRIGTNKVVQYRNDVWCWNLDGTYQLSDKKSKDYLCMSCWNKIRPLVKRENLAYETKTLINKLKREVTKCQQSKLKQVAN